MKMTQLFVFVVLLFSVPVNAQNWIRQDGFKMEVKTIPSSNPGVYPIFSTIPPSNNNDCSYIWDFDRAISFNLQALARYVGDDFDVNNLYFQANSSAAADFLEAWQQSWDDHPGETREIPPLNGYDWSNESVSFCVGLGVLLNHPLGYVYGFHGVFLWHDSSWARSGDIAWQPSSEQCQFARRWKNVITGEIIADKTLQSVSGHVVCTDYNVLPQCKP